MADRIMCQIYHNYAADKPSDIDNIEKHFIIHIQSRRYIIETQNSL